MANTVTLLSYANTYGDWMVTTNQLIKENNNFATGIYNKNSGTLYLNDATLGLQVTSNAIFASQMQVQGIGSGAYIQNNLRVGGTIQLTNTSIALTSNGTIYANASNNGLVVSNNAIISGNLTILGRLYSTQGDVTTYVDAANTWLQANDYATLTSSRNYTDSTNTAIFNSINTRLSTATANVTSLIDANNAIAYVKGIVVGNGGFSVGGGGSTGGLSLDGTTVSNAAIIFPAAGGTVSSNVSIKKVRPSATNAEIKYNDSKLYWEISSLGSAANFPTKYTSDSFYRILTAELLTDDLDLNFSASSTATYAASANAANVLNTSIKTNLIYAQAAFAAANLAANVANAGFSTANNAVDTWVRGQANTSFDKANSANVLAQSGFNHANSAFLQANLAFNAANNALDLWVRNQANQAFNQANASFDYANTIGVYSTAGFARANTSLNTVVGTTGLATPTTGVLSFASGNGVTITGSSNVLTVSTPQDVRTTSSPTFNSLSLANALAVTQGGTGSTSSTGALDTLLPASTGVGQVLATNGTGSYFWTSSTNVSAPGSTPGTQIRTNRQTYTGNGTGNTYTVPSYIPGSGQLRVYIDGVRQFPSEYFETSGTTVSFNAVNNTDNSPKPGTSILFEIDGFSNTTYYANNTAFTPNTLWTGTSANTVQLVIDALIGNVAWANNTTLYGKPTAPTAANTTSNTMIATTAFVQNLLNSGNSYNIVVAVANTKVIGLFSSANLTTTGVTAATYGSSTNYPVFTVDAAGRVTSATNQPFTIQASAVSGLILPSANLSNTGVTTSTANLSPITFGTANTVPVITVDPAGRITSVTNTLISVANTRVTGTFSSSNLTNTGVTTATSNLSSITFGNTITYPIITVDPAGRITSVTNTLISVANTQVTGLFSSSNLTNTGVTIATGNISSITFGNSTFIPVITVDPAGRIVSVANTSAQPDLPNLLTAGTFGNASNNLIISVDAKGRITSIANVTQSIANTRVTGLFSSANLNSLIANPVTYGNTSHYPVIAVDAAGRITTISNTFLSIPATQVTGTFSSSNLTSTGVVATTYGSANTLPVIAVDSAGRVTSVTNTLISVANTRVTGLFTSANLNITGVTAASYGAANIVPTFTVDSAGRLSFAGNTGILLPTTQLSGTITTGQLGTTSTPQFASVGLGVAANTTAGSLNIVQNSFAKIGNTYISSGGTSALNYAHFSNQTWYNGTGWTAETAGVGAMYQMAGNTHNWYKSTGNQFTNGLLMSLDPSGNLVSLGNMTAFGSPSDINLKENIVRIDTALDKITNINGYYYNYKSDANKTRLLGVIAQEIEPIVPEVVYDFTPLGAEQSSKAVRYEHLTVLLIEAIKELNQEIIDLKHEVDVLKGK
jgi:hypothetical protein